MHNSGLQQYSKSKLLQHYHRRRRHRSQNTSKGGGSGGDVVGTFVQQHKTRAEGAGKWRKAKMGGGVWTKSECMLCGWYIDDVGGCVSRSLIASSVPSSSFGSPA